MPRPDAPELLRQVGLLTAIPFVLLAGPALGYYVGGQVDRHWAHAPWGIGIGITLGLVSSGRVTMQLIRQANHITRPRP